MTHIDEEAEPVDWKFPADVVGLTFHTPSAYHAYDIAAHFRRRGVCVVMGGPHVTLLPDEAAQHADVIFAGEAEGLWEDFLDGYVTGNYRRICRCTSPPSLENALAADQALFHRRDHTAGVLFATRGCPHAYDFCTIAVIYPHGFRRRPVAVVAAEYASFRGKVIIFWETKISPATAPTPSGYFGPSRRTGSGGAARRVSRREETMSSWRPPRAADASSCSWGWNPFRRRV